MRLVDIEPLIDECDELISIEWNYKVAPPSWADAEEEFRQRLLDAPVIEAEPVKHGRWLQPKSGECFCSECKTLGSPQWKRCPVCEAKMSGGDNDA